MIIHADKSAKWPNKDCANVAWFLNTIPALKIAAMNLMPMQQQRPNWRSEYDSRNVLSLRSV